MDDSLDMRVIKVIAMGQTAVDKGRLPDGEPIAVTDNGALRGSGFFSGNIPDDIGVG